MKKYSVQIIGTLDDGGSPAFLEITAEAKWIPLHIEDSSKMENFRPQRIPELKLYVDGVQLFGWSFPEVPR